jgi:type VII secretion-associated serine protease mycosin
MPAHTLPVARGMLQNRRWAPPAAALLVALVSLVPGPAAATPARVTGSAVAAAAVCPTPPQAGAVDAAVPWPQARYDYAAIGRLSQGAGVTVAVLDSGVDTSNPQLAGAITGGGDLIGAGSGLDDCVGHGTEVASIIAARPVAGIAFHGIAPAASVLSIRVSDRVETADGPVGQGDVTALVNGIQRAVAARPRPGVLNLSISTDTDDPALHAAIQAALDADIVVVAAVGNAHRTDGTADPTPYPAAYAGVVGVGAISDNSARQTNSQVGSYVDLVAPGDGVLAATRVSGHALVSGTSFAAPFVAGTAALIRSRFPGLDRTEVVRRLLATADPASGNASGYGYGALNPLRALTEVLPPPARAGPPATPAPVLPARTAVDDGHPSPSVAVLAVAAALLLGALLVATVALAAPAGRRRGWRPGTVDTAPDPRDDDEPPLFIPDGIPKPAYPALEAARSAGPRAGEHLRVPSADGRPGRGQDPARVAGPTPGLRGS